MRLPDLRARMKWMDVIVRTLERKETTLHEVEQTRVMQLGIHELRQ